MRVSNAIAMALAYHGLNDDAEARRWLGRAVEVLDRDPPGISDEPGTVLLADWPGAQVLRREAEASTRPEPASPADPSAR